MSVRRSSMYPRRHLLLVVPDDRERSTLVAQLHPAGYAVSTACTGTEAIDSREWLLADLVIADVEIPDADDLALRPIAERPPVLCVTSCEALERLLPSLGVHVEDYVTKPCRVPELLARVDVLLREKDPGPDGPVLTYRDLLLDESVCLAWRGDRLLDVTPAEFRLLRHLMVNAGRVVTKERLAREVSTSLHGVNAIEQLVSRLRRKVDETGRSLIHTRRGFGYLME